MTTFHEKIAAEQAKIAGFSETEINAALTYIDRRDRVTNPPGDFDKAGRFYADERTEATNNCRNPTRSFPYPEMKAARTAAHCAELFDADELNTKRAANLIDKFSEQICEPEEILSAARYAAFQTTRDYKHAADMLVRLADQPASEEHNEKIAKYEAIIAAYDAESAKRHEINAKATYTKAFNKLISQVFSSLNKKSLRPA